MDQRIFTGAFGAVGIALLSACAAPTQTELNSADYGKYPDNYESIIKDYYYRILKDPFSVRYKDIPPPAHAWKRDLGKILYGYKVCVTYTAKNSYGAYGGWQTDYILIHNGVVIDVVNDAGKIDQNIGTTMCK